jgi:hypothetical protein
VARYVETKVLGEAHCQRCNALAKLVARRQKELSDAFEVRIECDKCKHSSLIELASASQIRRIDRRAELMGQWKKASPAQKGRIMNEIRRLEQEEKNWLQSL